jgi:hypothetical protein
MRNDRIVKNWRTKRKIAVWRKEYNRRAAAQQVGVSDTGGISWSYGAGHRATKRTIQNPHPLQTTQRVRHPQGQHLKARKQQLAKLIRDGGKRAPKARATRQKMQVAITVIIASRFVQLCPTDCTAHNACFSEIAFREKFQRTERVFRKLQLKRTPWCRPGRSSRHEPV